MASVGRGPIKGKKIKGKRKRLKLIISLAGAVIVFGTFLVKDMERDKMKDLVDSIEAAENAYLGRMGNRQTYSEIKNFEQQFAEFRKNPREPYKEGGGSNSFDGPKDSIDFNLLGEIRAETISAFDLIQDISRVTRKFQKARSENEEIGTIKADVVKLLSSLMDIGSKTEGLRLLPREQYEATIQQVNKDLYRLQDIRNDIRTKLDDLAGRVIEDAEREREIAEQEYEAWSTTTNLLYIFGFVLAIMGILMGSDTEAVIEAVQEEI